MSKPLPTPAQMRQLLRYEADTGQLFWLEAPVELFVSGRYSAERKCLAWNGKYSGREALYHRDRPGDYAYGDVFGTKVYAHRAIAAIVQGEWPSGDVDHISGDRTDNRLVNLRCVTRAENARNRPLASHNKSGAMGVYWDQRRQKWAAEIFLDGKRKHIGRFGTLDEAKVARARHEAAMGFHPNHGRHLSPLT